MRNIFARVRQPSLRQGLIFGLILEVIQFILGFISALAAVESLIALALFAIFGYLAGQKAAKETGKLATGALAGLFTGVIGFVLVGLLTFIEGVTLVQQFVNYYTTHPAPGVKPSTYTPSFVLTNIAINLFMGLTISTLIAIIGGTIGGLVGRSRARVAESDEYEEAMFVPPSTD